MHNSHVSGPRIELGTASRSVMGCLCGWLIDQLSEWSDHPNRAAMHVAAVRAVQALLLLGSASAGRAECTCCSAWWRSLGIASRFNRLAPKGIHSRAVPCFKSGATGRGWCRVSASAIMRRTPRSAGCVIPRSHIDPIHVRCFSPLAPHRATLRSHGQSIEECLRQSIQVSSIVDCPGLQT